MRFAERHDVPNLYVVDGSVFPSSSEKNPTLTIMALAARTADHISDRFQKGRDLMKSRREALKIIGAVGVTCAFPFSANELYGQHVHPSGEAATQEAKPPRLPRDSSPRPQLLVISRLTDLIIPPTDTPGAAAAGVPHTSIWW